MNVQEFLNENHEVRQAVESAIKEEITEVTLMSKGSTNRSYLVRTNCNSYVLRVPGKGAEDMVDRYLEKEIYSLINGYDVGDQVIYLNPENGIKISIYYENARFLDLTKEKDVKLFLKTVKKLHGLNLQCSGEYDFFKNILKYENLRNSSSRFEDYESVKKDILSLKSFTEVYCGSRTLIHNDLSNENCLLFKGEDGKEKCVLIDFEYAAMQCPAADIAYFCVFSELDEAAIDKIIEDYYEDDCSVENYARVYAYIALNALLHSNWLELKLSLENVHKEKRIKESIKAFNLAKLYYKKFEEVKNAES